MWYGWNHGIKYFEKSKAYKCLQLGIITIWIGWNEIWVPHSLLLLEEYLFTPHLMNTLSLDLWRLARCSPRDLNYYCYIHRTQFYVGLGGVAAFPFTFLKLLSCKKNWPRLSKINSPLNQVQEWKILAGNYGLSESRSDCKLGHMYPSG